MNQKAFDLGALGFTKNRQNPYSLSSYLYREWERGFNTAYFENLEKVKQRESRKGS